MTKKKSLIILGLFCLGSRLWAGEPDKSLQDQTFTVETSDEDAAASLNRVSGGDIDLGFSAPHQSYKAEHHGRQGAMSDGELHDRSSSEY